MRLWLEKFILTICAAIVISLSILNPLKWDWQQRVSLGLAVAFFAYWVAHTHNRMEAATDPNQELKATLQGQQHEIDSLKQQLTNNRAEEAEKRKRRLAIRNQLGVFLDEGKRLQERIEYSNLSALNEKTEWERRVEEYLAKEFFVFSMQFDGEKPDEITRGACNDDRVIFENCASRKFGAAQGSKLFFQTNRKGRWACGPSLNLGNQIRCDVHLCASTLRTRKSESQYRQVDSGSFRQPVVRSGGAVRRRGVALRRIPFRAGESLVAPVRPSPTKDAFSIGDSNRNRK